MNIAHIVLKVVGWTLTILSILVFCYFCILIRPIDFIGIMYFLVTIIGMIVGVWVIRYPRKLWMEYKGYYGDYKYEKQNNTYHGRVMNCKDAFLYYEAESTEKIEDAFRETIDTYLHEKEAV